MSNNGMIASLVADEKIVIGDFLQFNKLGRVIRMKRKADFIGVALDNAVKDAYLNVQIYGTVGGVKVYGTRNGDRKEKSKIIPTEVKHEELKSEI